MRWLAGAMNKMRRDGPRRQSPPSGPPSVFYCGACGEPGRAVVAIRPSGVKRMVVEGCRCERGNG